MSTDKKIVIIDTREQFRIHPKHIKQIFWLLTRRTSKGIQSSYFVYLFLLANTLPQIFHNLRPQIFNMWAWPLRFDPWQPTALSHLVLESRQHIQGHFHSATIACVPWNILATRIRPTVLQFSGLFRQAWLQRKVTETEKTLQLEYQNRRVFATLYSENVCRKQIKRSRRICMYSPVLLLFWNSVAAVFSLGTKKWKY